MRSTVLILLLCLLGSVAYAQDGDQGDGSGQQNKATINYTVGDLEKLNKLELTSIYIAKLQRLHNILPYIPFEKLEPKSPNDLRIPSKKDNTKAIEDLQQVRKEYNEKLAESMSQLAPYADTKQLVNAILFIQSYINKIELIGLGMNKLGY
jgi:hypothetical protein